MERRNLVVEYTLEEEYICVGEGDGSKTNAIIGK